MKRLWSKAAPFMGVALVLGILLAGCDNWPAPHPTGVGDDGCTPGVDECASDADCGNPLEHCDTDTCTCVPQTILARACAANSDNCNSNDDCYNEVCDRPGCNCTCCACGEYCPWAGKSHGDPCTTPGSGVSGTCDGCKCVIPACAGDASAVRTPASGGQAVRARRTRARRVVVAAAAVSAAALPLASSQASSALSMV